MSGGSGSGKTNVLFNLIGCQPDIDESYLYAKQRLQSIKGLKYCKDSKSFIEYLIDVGNICKNIEEHNPDKERKILIVFHDMIADMLSKKKLNQIVTKLCMKVRKLNISHVFTTHSYFAI